MNLKNELPAYSAAETTVVLLAAGYGKRMRPLTDHTPKPLLKVGQHSLIEHHLFSLANQGFRKVVINIAHLAEQFKPALGGGENYGLSISYSDESASGPLETAGGLVNALPLITSDPFITVNADIWTDYQVKKLLQSPIECAKLVMVSNPDHNPDGDFALADNGMLVAKLTRANSTALNALTYSGMAIYHKSLFENLPAGKQALAPIFRELIQENRLEGTRLSGTWYDIGTPERLAELQQAV